MLWFEPAHKIQNLEPFYFLINKTAGFQIQFQNFCQFLSGRIKNQGYFKNQKRFRQSASRSRLFPSYLTNGKMT